MGRDPLFVFNFGCIYRISMGMGETIEELYGAKHSPPGGTFQKSGGPHASGPGPRKSRFQKSNCIQMKNSRFRLNDFQRIFQLCPPQVLNPPTDVGPGQHFGHDLGDLEKIDFLKSSFMKSRGVKCHPW